MNSNQNYNQAGQTLIETLVASMVLVMGISAAVGLAIYGLSATTTVNKQLVANGLAREGIEAVKNMRDTNWLRSGADSNCFDFYTQTNIGLCHRSWLNISGGYNIDPGAGGSQTYTLGTTTSGSNTYWRLIPTSTLYGLNLTSSDLSSGLYSVTATGVSVVNSSSQFGRKITISKDTFQPFDKSDLGPRLKVRVDVWWTDKRCPASDTVPTNSRCLVTLETYLTNWKNY